MPDDSGLPAAARPTELELFPEYAPLSLSEGLGSWTRIDPAASLRGRDRFLIYRQETDYSCGSACLRMILGYFGIPAEERAIRRVGQQTEMFLRSIEGESDYKTEDQGIGSSGLIAVVRKYRLHGFIMKRRNSSMEGLAFFLSSDIPVIVNWQYEHNGFDWAWRGVPILLNMSPEEVHGMAEKKKRVTGHYGHYSVAVGFSADRRYLVLADPSGNVYFVSVDYFESRWWDPTPKHSRWMMAVYPDKSINRSLKKSFKGLFV